MLQLEGLYLLIQKAKLREYEIQASLHGVQFKHKLSDSQGVAEADPKVPMFQDPEEYKTMSKEDREKETKRMMGLHKRWSGDALHKKPKVNSQ